MENKRETSQLSPMSKPNLFGLLRPYRGLVLVLTALVLVANALTLWLPRLLSAGIDQFLRNQSLHVVIWQFSIASGLIFVLTYLQSIVQTLASEKVAKDLRNNVSAKISSHSFASIQQTTSARLLTNLTSDVDSVKNFVSQAIVNIISSVFLILGGSILLIATNWKLGLAVLAVLPIIGITFFVVLVKVRTLFLQSREVIDWLNKVINESILGAALIRVLNSGRWEHEKFAQANARARDVGITILKLFSVMVPIFTFCSNLAILIILVLGGRFIIDGTMTLGEFAAFNSYLLILIFPIFILGFVSNIMAQAQASYGRILPILLQPESKEGGSLIKVLEGNIQVKNIQLLYEQKNILKNISFNIQPKSKVAIIGPTAAGKTQLLNILIGLVKPTSGSVEYDNHSIDEYQPSNLYQQVGLVFQDSIIFNMSLRENIAFNIDVKEGDLQKAIDTAELADFVTTLPEGLNTNVSERGTNLSGGQKQRIMLARALAINPKVLLLDDFTARVDATTEKKILENIARNYPDLTLVSVTQKIASVQLYDQIIVLTEGEVVATGKHQELLTTSPEYVQIYESQQSTNIYDVSS